MVRMITKITGREGSMYGGVCVEISSSIFTSFFFGGGGGGAAVVCLLVYVVGLLFDSLLFVLFSGGSCGCGCSCCCMLLFWVLCCNN